MFVPTLLTLLLGNPASAQDTGAPPETSGPVIDVEPSDFDLGDLELPEEDEAEDAEAADETPPEAPPAEGPTPEAPADLDGTPPAPAPPAEPPPDPGADLSFATILPATWQSEDEGLEAEAARLQRRYAGALAQRFLTVPMADVPAFTDYDAETYLLSCPAGQYDDCAALVGERADVDYVVGAVLSVTDDGPEAAVSYVRVSDTRELLRLRVPIRSRTEEAVLAGLVSVMEVVASGGADPVDVRELTGGPDQEVADRVQVVASELAAFEAEAGTATRGAQRLTRDRLTVDEARELAGGEAEAPWQRLGLSRASWRRWKNSGETLIQWRERARGRQLTLLLHGTAIVAGAGPWVTRYEGWRALDDRTLDVYETFVLLDQERGAQRGWELGAAIGVTPWLDVGVWGGPRIDTFRWRLVQVVQDQEPRPVDDQSKPVPTWHAGARVGLAPFPTLPARPTLHAGVWGWFGVAREKVLEVPPELPTLGRPWMLLAQVAPGAEVDVGRTIKLYARFHVDVPVAGRVAQQDLAGGAILTDRPEASVDDDGVGLGGSLGAIVRIKLTKTKPPRKTGRAFR